MRVNKNGETSIKILYWGCAGCGKTTAIDTLYMLTKNQYTSDLEPPENLVKMAMASGATIYFDRGIFQSKKRKSLFYHVYTVAGQSRFGPLRQQIFAGTDGVCFIFDAQRHLLQDNLDSLEELKSVAGNQLITKIPLIVMVNKQDLPDPLKKDEVELILKNHGLFYPPNHPLFPWNPIIYESVALFECPNNIYQVFSELARRTTLYQQMGQGEAPKIQKQIVMSQWEL
jgi:GTPase SAR1 family protein